MSKQSAAGAFCLRARLMCTLVSIFFIACSSNMLTSARADHPNVVLVITDDQGYGDVAFHGNKEIQTPTMDKLARSSLRLTNFHVEPTCAETRAALMTGQFPLRGGVWHTIMGRSILRKTSVTLPQLFQEAGYRTGQFGKWHLGDNYPYRPQDRGFDVSLHLGGGGITQVPDVWGNDYFDDVYWANEKLQPARGYCTDVFFDAAKKFITDESNKPFFCYIATNAPHSPYTVADNYKKPYLDKGIEEPRASFYGMITNIDDNLAQLLELLEKRGIADNTIVVFMTDNGSAAGSIPATPRQPAKGYDGGMRAKKGSQYDGGHRVPCFIRYPRQLPVDKDFGSLCAHVDLMPTLARLCDLKTDRVGRLDGRDLVDYVKGDKSWTDRTLVVQSHRVEEPVAWRKSAVMTDRWRLVDGEELYDIKADPKQARPLKGPEHQSTIDTLRAAYESWWKEMAVDPSIYSNISLGDPKAPRVRLTGHDWHGPTPVVMQDNVLKDPLSLGFWAVEVVRPGAYQFLLSRRPLDEPAPTLAVRAKLEIGGKKVEVDAAADAVLVPITVRLEPGVTKLTTELIREDGKSTSAYFVTVNYLGDLPQSEIDAASSRLPDWLRPGDRVAWLGGTLIERAAGSGALETEVMLRAPLAGLSFVNLGWSGDDFSGRARAVFGAEADGKVRRLSDIKLSGASVVAIAYGMSELLDTATSPSRTEMFERELKELVAAVRSESKRSVLCLPPHLVDDIQGTAAAPTYQATCRQYDERYPLIAAMLKRVAESEKVPLVELPAIQTSWFESGTYLSVQGYRNWGNRVGDALFKSAKSPAVASRAKEASLYELAIEGQRLFFDMHRPQNETYLLLFRKHEQGNNAVELRQFRPLLADVQLELMKQAAEGQ